MSQAVLSWLSARMEILSHHVTLYWAATRYVNRALDKESWASWPWAKLLTGLWASVSSRQTDINTSSTTFTEFFQRPKNKIHQESMKYRLLWRQKPSFKEWAIACLELTVGLYSLPKSPSCKETYSLGCRGKKKSSAFLL